MPSSSRWPPAATRRRRPHPTRHRHRPPRPHPTRHQRLNRTRDLTPAAAQTRLALLAAARDGDWDAIAGLIPEDTLFTSNFSGESDHIAYYRDVEGDLTEEIVALLEGPFAQLDDIVVWPELHARVPFEIADDERAELEQRYGAERLEQWEGAGSYLGWRIGITDDGEWIFLVAGD